MCKHVIEVQCISIFKNIRKEIQCDNVYDQHKQTAMMGQLNEQQPSWETRPCFNEGDI